MSGKGSKLRPMKVSRVEYEDNWEKVFGRVNAPSDRDDTNDCDANRDLNAEAEKEVKTQK